MSFQTETVFARCYECALQHQFSDPGRLIKNVLNSVKFNNFQWNKWSIEQKTFQIMLLEQLCHLNNWSTAQVISIEQIANYPTCHLK